MIKISDTNLLVSVITPTYNSVDFIEECIASVQSQSYQSIEHIIVDDGSTDGTIDLVKKLSQADKRIKLIQFDKNKGAAVARNRAIEEAKGRFIAFLDSDDLWLPEKLQMQIAFMTENEIAFCYSNYIVINEKGAFVERRTVSSKLNYVDILKSCQIGCLTAIYDAKLLGKIYMPEIKKRQDFGLWLKILKKTEYGYGINEELSKYRIRAGSLSSNKISAALHQWKMLYEYEKIGFVKSSYYFSLYALAAIRRRLVRFLKK